MSALSRILVGLTLLLAASASRANIAASDNSRNYASGWTNNSNGGFGFAPWFIKSAAGGKFTISDVSDAGGSAFHLTSSKPPKGGSSFVHVFRAFPGPLGVGDVLSFDWGATDVLPPEVETANRGFYLESRRGKPLGMVGDVVLINVNRYNKEGRQVIAVNGEVLPAIPLAPLTWSVTMLDPETILLAATSRGANPSLVYRQEIKVPNEVDVLSFYDLNSGPGYSWFDNLTVTRAASAAGVPAITNSPVAQGVVGKAFNFQVSASNEPTSYAAKGLPQGLAVDGKTGVISGTPVAKGTFNAEISASNAYGKGTAPLIVAIADAPIPANDTFVINVDGSAVTIERWGKGPQAIIFFGYAPFRMADELKAAYGSEFASLVGDKYSMFLWTYPEKAPLYSQALKSIDAFVEAMQNPNGDPSGVLAKRVALTGQATSVVNQIRTATGLSDVYLVGNSFGAGVVLWDLAALASDPRLRFVLLSPSELFMPFILPSGDSLPRTLLVADAANDPFFATQSARDYISQRTSAIKPPGYDSSDSQSEVSAHFIIGEAPTSLPFVFGLLDNFPSLTTQPTPTPSPTPVPAPTLEAFRTAGGWQAYLAANVDVFSAGYSDEASAFAHWRDYGRKEGRKFDSGRLRSDLPSGAVDPQYAIDGGFAWQYPDTNGVQGNTMVFITKDAPKPAGWDGRALLLRKSEVFNLGPEYTAAAYGQLNSDVKQAIESNLFPSFASVTDHYVKYGFKEGRLTNGNWTQTELNAWFDEGYLSKHSDVRSFFMGAQGEGWKLLGKIGFAHYINFGRWEGRATGQ